MLSAGLIFFLAALQGVTELFPVSSLGHAVVVPPLIGLNFQESSPAFVPVLAVLHLGTAGGAARFSTGATGPGSSSASSALRLQGRIDGPDQRLAIMLIIGSVPAGIVGFLLQDPLKSLFANPRLAAASSSSMAGSSCRRDVPASRRATARSRRCTSPRTSRRTTPPTSRSKD